MKRPSPIDEPTDEQLRQLGQVIRRAQRFIHSIASNRPEVITAHLETIQMEALEILQDWNELTSGASQSCDSKAIN